MDTNLDRLFRLGPWLVRPSLGQITGPDGDVHLEPKVMGVLLCLATDAGEVVTRDRFVDQVWDGRAVSDEVLSRCISQLRTRLGDDPRDPRYIQTVPKIGYRLVMPVEPVGDSSNGREVPAAAVQPQTRSAARNRIIVLLCLVALAAAGMIWLQRTDQPAPESGPAAIAVLPFKNIGEDPGDEYFSDGLTDELINRLANLPELQVVASASAFALKDQREDARSVAARLGVDYLLQGSVRKNANRVRITVELVDAERGFARWSNRYDTTLADIFDIQDRISSAIVTELRPQLSASVEPAAVMPPTAVMPAYELLLRGKFHLKKREEAPILQSIALFEKAIELDPHFGEAYRELARAYALLPTYSYEDPDEMFDKAEVVLERGARMAPATDEAFDDVRAFLHFARWEWIEAEEDFRRALVHSSNDPNLHQWYSQMLAAVGKPELALQAVLEAKRLDVLSPVVNQRLAVVYLWVDDDERALRQFELASELGIGLRANQDGHVIQLVRSGRFDEARELLLDLQRAFARAADWIDPFIAALRDPALRPAANDALRQAVEDRQISLKYLHGAWVFLGDADAAIEAAFDLLHEPQDFEVEFLFARENAASRAHPRFGELVRAIGLDTYWDRYGWPGFCARTGGDIVCH